MGHSVLNIQSTKVQNTSLFEVVSFSFMLSCPGFSSRFNLINSKHCTKILKCFSTSELILEMLLFWLERFKVENGLKNMIMNLADLVFMFPEDSEKAQKAKMMIS